MEEESPRRMKEFIPYQVNAQMLEHAPKDVLVMHPLPAFRGLEISDDALDGKNSVVWQQTRNRLYVQKAIIKKLMD
jgi:ornithine carbamoyltransferase